MEGREWMSSHVSKHCNKQEYSNRDNMGVGAWHYFFPWLYWHCYMALPHPFYHTPLSPVTSAPCKLLYSRVQQESELSQRYPHDRAAGTTLASQILSGFTFWGPAVQQWNRGQKVLIYRMNEPNLDLKDGSCQRLSWAISAISFK